MIDLATDEFWFEGGLDDRRGLDAAGFAHDEEERKVADLGPGDGFRGGEFGVDFFDQLVDLRIAARFGAAGGVLLIFPPHKEAGTDDAHDAQQPDEDVERRVLEAEQKTETDRKTDPNNESDKCDYER